MITGWVGERGGEREQGQATDMSGSSFPKKRKTPKRHDNRGLGTGYHPKLMTIGAWAPDVIFLLGFQNWFCFGVFSFTV